MGYKTPSGTASQYLMADGSVSLGIAPVREVADEFSATASQTSLL
jgi:prepilin-type processing-associated H-X9-DG protein